MTDGVCVTVRVGGAVLKGRGERHLRGGGGGGWTDRTAAAERSGLSTPAAHIHPGGQAGRGPVRLDSECRFRLGLVLGFGTGRREPSNMRWPLF